MGGGAAGEVGEDFLEAACEPVGVFVASEKGASFDEQRRVIDAFALEPFVSRGFGKSGCREEELFQTRRLHAESLPEDEVMVATSGEVRGGVVMGPGVRKARRGRIANRPRWWRG